MSHCYAGKTFLVVRTALRREVLLALMRVWDRSQNAIRMDFIRGSIATKRIIELLAKQRAGQLGLPEEADAMAKDLASAANKAVKLIDKYSKGGAKWPVIEQLQRLRHERLAHRQTDLKVQPELLAKDIEAFYVDTAELVKLLSSVVIANAYEAEDLAEVCRHDAKYFWDGALSEHTEGHPSYHPPRTAEGRA
jgi:AbiU2